MEILHLWDPHFSVESLGLPSEACYQAVAQDDAILRNKVPVNICPTYDFVFSPHLFIYYKRQGVPWLERITAS